MNLEKAKIGDVIHTLYSPEYAEKRVMKGHVQIYIGDDKWVNTGVILLNNTIEDMKSNFAYSTAQVIQHEFIISGSIDDISENKIRKVIEYIFKFNQK